MIRWYQLTYFIRHFLQLLLRATHDHNIQTTSSKLQKFRSDSMKREKSGNTLLYFKGIALSNSFRRPCNHCMIKWVSVYGTHITKLMLIQQLWLDVHVPAHDPYFSRFILDIPKGARKKAQKSPARAFRTFNINQESQRTPTTAATSLYIHIQ